MIFLGYHKTLTQNLACLCKMNKVYAKLARVSMLLLIFMDAKAWVSLHVASMEASRYEELLQLGETKVIFFIWG